MKTYEESLDYIIKNLDNIIETNKRITKLPKIEGKAYVDRFYYDIILSAVSSTSKKIKNKSYIISIAENIRLQIDNN